MTDDPDSLTVVGHDETDDGVQTIETWCDVARQTLRSEGIRSGALDLIFIEELQMHELNRTHMGADRPTDVLAFPLDGPDGAPNPDEDGPPSHLGDVVICPKVAREQAPGHCGSFESEMTLLVVHGVLHVLGHDHAEPDETRVMQARERHHLDRHGYRHPVPA